MLAKRPAAPVIGNLTNSIMSGGIWDSTTTTSPKTPSEFKILSPRGLINYDLSGIGLGIVAAMEKFVDNGNQIPANKLFCRRNSSRSNPIPVNSPIANNNNNRGEVLEEEEENGEDSLEDYTFVTGLGPDNKMFARVYYDDGDFDRRRRRRSNRNNNPSLFTVSSPVGFGDFPDFPDSDFLTCCHMCHKKLIGKDIYMYMGEKAFCSTECRYKQIVFDEKKEKCSSGFVAGSSRSVVEASSTSPINSGGEMIFSPGILAM